MPFLQTWRSHRVVVRSCRPVPAPDSDALFTVVRSTVIGLCSVKSGEITGAPGLWHFGVADGSAS
jgi:hypothetical protein